MTQNIYLKTSWNRNRSFTKLIFLLSYSLELFLFEASLLCSVHIGPIAININYL